MINLIKSEVFKMRKMRGVKVLFLLAWLGAAGTVLLSYLTGQGTIRGELGDIVFMLSELQMMTLLGGLLASMVICSDFENKTIQDAVACGNSRLQVIGSRMISYGGAVALLLVPYACMTLLMYILGLEFSSTAVQSVFIDILLSVSGKGLQMDVIIHIIGVVLYLMLMYVAQLSICVFLSFLFKKAIPVIGISYALSLITGLLLSWEGRMELVGKIISWTPYKYVYGTVSMTMEMSTILQGAAVSIAMIMLMIYLTWLIFRRAEIK